MSLGTTIFVIHGRDERARREVFHFLRAVGLSPVSWDRALREAGGGAPSINQVVDKAIRADRAFLVLLTPDDVVYLKRELADDEHDPETQSAGQARPNVLFEAGMALGRFPEHTVLVEFGKVRKFTDIDGLYRVQLNDSPEARHTLAHRLAAIGCDVNLEDKDWYTAGSLIPPANTSTAPVSTATPPASGDRPRNTVSEAGQIEFTSNAGSWQVILANFNVNLKSRSPLVVHGEITNREPSALTLVLKGTFYLDRRIVGSATGTIFGLAKDEQRAFELRTWDIPDEFDKVHVHVDNGMRD